MREEQGYITHAIKNGICWVQLYSNYYDDEDLLEAVNYCGFYPPGFEFVANRVRGCDKPILNEPPIKGKVGDVWVIKGSIRKDDNGSVRDSE
jgi:hypothetical protein